MSSVNVAPASSHRGRPPGKAPLSTHSRERLGDDRGPVAPAGVAEVTRRTSSAVGRGVIRSTTVVTAEARLVDPRGEVGIDQLREVAQHAADHRTVVGEVVARHERERAGVGPPPGGDAREQPGGSGADERARVAAQGLDVGTNLRVDRGRGRRRRRADSRPR